MQIIYNAAMSNTHNALRRDSMAERVRQELLRRIMSGDLPPGARLVELELARDLNTSQGPVREALRRLEGSDLVVTEPYKGSRVRDVTAQDIYEAYAVRAALEELAAQQAAKSLKGRVGELRKEAEAIRKAATQKNLELYAKHDHNFHRLIVEAAQNRILLRTWNSLAFEVRIQIRLAKGKVNLSRAQEAHWEILKALEAGNANSVARLLRKHIHGLPDLDRGEAKISR
ncbi:MAG: GntR family transcriptional regulator [Acidobacteriaceae bacterium]